MKGILFEYDMPPATWVYVSSLMMIGIFFRFNRFFSVRNLDLIALIFFSPGMLLLSHAQERLGYVWLFSVGGVFLVRLLLDPLMVRRPLLEPNLSASGLTFTGLALLVFLMSNVIQGREIFSPDPGQQDPSKLVVRGPGYPHFYAFANLSNPAVPAKAAALPELRDAAVREAVSRTAAILGHFAILLGIVLIGYRHFDNIQTGVATATLYLLLPYTAQMTGHVDHVIPGALLVWAVAMYRRPALAGIFIGLASGMIFYPLFLLPLWCSFYWRRGLIRFVVAVVLVLLLLVLSLVLSAESTAVLASQLKEMFGWTTLWLKGANGFWEHHELTFRYPVLAAFVVLCGSLALWPPHKNLGTLLSCSAVVMLGVQYWHTYQGGLYMAWYLPLLVLTIFRPNLEDRVALTAVIERRTPWRRAAPAAA